MGVLQTPKRFLASKLHEVQLDSFAHPPRSCLALVYCEGVPKGATAPFEMRCIELPPPPAPARLPLSKKYRRGRGQGVGTPSAASGGTVSPGGSVGAERFSTGELRPRRGRPAPSQRGLSPKATGGVRVKFRFAQLTRSKSLGRLFEAEPSLASLKLTTSYPRSRSANSAKNPWQAF